MRGLVVVSALIATVARAEPWEAAPGADSRIVVHVHKRGVFSAFAHDHHFEVTEWRAAANIPDPQPTTATVQVVLSAASLRDRQESLSADERRKVDAQAAGAEVLDASHHPRVEFRSERFEVAPGGHPDHFRGVLHGILTIRGQRAPADANVEAERGSGVWRVRGGAHVKQSAFGIKPYSGFGGTVAVKDELDIEFSLTMRPRR